MSNDGETKTIVVENTSWNSQDHYLADRQNIYWHEPPDLTCFQALPAGMEAKTGDRVTFYYGPWHYDENGRPSSRSTLGIQLNDGPVVQ